MEENRKKKAVEEETAKKEQLKMKKVQGIVDQLKGHREILYKLGSKMTKGKLEEYLQMSNKVEDNSIYEEVKESSSFRIGSKETID